MNTRTFAVVAPMGEGVLAKLVAAGQVDIAGAGDQAIGCTDRLSYAADEPTTVALFGPVVRLQAAAPFAAGVRLYGAAAGQVDAVAAPGSWPCGVSLQAAAAQGDIIEALLMSGEQVPV